jgi:hypothetical protein
MNSCIATGMRNPYLIWTPLIRTPKKDSSPEKRMSGLEGSSASIACLVSEQLPAINTIPNRPQLQSIEDVMGGVTRVCLGNYHMFLHTSLQRQQLFRSVMSHSTGL